MKNIYDTFEFDYIRNRLEEHASTELGKNYVRKLTMFQDVSSLKIALEELKEGIRYCYRYAKPAIHYHADLVPHLVALKKGGTGSEEFFYQVSFLLENIRALKQEFRERESFSLLAEMIDSLQTLDAVKQRIDRVISPSLEILDSASSNLYRIRSKISRLEGGLGSLSNSLIDRYRNYLSDTHGSMKNGIFTLMVKATYKNRVPGIVHAISDTGMTAFIEPQEMIEVYNTIASLREEERKEIQAILKDLSAFVSAYDFSLLEDHLTVGKLDFLFAKATYAISYRGEIASVSEEKKIRLLQAAHPLIDPDKVVRNDFFMDRERMMVITGPNAGGKTVALKVVGLLVMMHQSGLAIPVKEGAELPFFSSVYADIGDHQSLLDNLSTFSSHMVAIRDILGRVDEDSLVIIDELGSGTSPTDGEALGLGIIDYLLESRCFSMISSHYEGIKNYALENDDILCASMIFDEEEIRPTYRLRLHVASSSYGVEVASRLGLQESVVERARAYIEEKKQSDKEISLERLNQVIAETEIIKADLLEKEKELEKTRLHLREQEEKNKETRNRILEEAEEEKRKIVEEAKEEIDAVFREFRNLENKKLHQVIDAKRKIDEKAEIEEEVYDEANVVPGDSVEVIASRTRGKVTRVDRDRVTVLLESGMTLMTKRSAIRKCQVVPKRKSTDYIPDIVASMKRVPTECNVIGMTVKEALGIVSKYLDDCVSVHYKQVRIIHGSGTGKLRSGIQNYLKGSPYVESFRLGGGGEGGVGATVVTLK